MSTVYPPGLSDFTNQIPLINNTQISDLLFYNNNQAEVINTNAETTFLTFDVPAGKLGINDGVYIKALLQYRNASGAGINITPRLYWGGLAVANTIFAMANGSTRSTLMLECFIQNVNAANVQHLEFIWANDTTTAANAGSGVSVATAITRQVTHSNQAKDTTAQQTIALTAQMASADPSAGFIPRVCYMRLLR